MPITIVGVGAVDSSSPFAPAFAGPVLADDIILILVEQASLTSPEASPSATGFAHALGSPVGPDAAGTVLSVLWKRAAGGETSATVTGPSNHGVTRAITIRGVKNTGNPWNVNPAVVTDNAASTTATWLAVTPTATDCLICLCIATGRDANSTANLGAVTNANLTSLTKHMDNWVSSGTGGGIGLVTGFKATATTTGTSTATMGSTDGKALMTLALEPGAAATVAQAESATVTVTAATAAGLDLPVTDGLTGRWDATKITGLADGAAVATWADTSSAGRHATQATGTLQPTYQTAELNGNPVVRFDGTNDYLATGAFTAEAQPHTIFIVARLTSTATEYFIDGLDTANRHALLWNAGLGQIEQYAGASVLGGSLTATQPVILTAVFNTTSSEVFKDGVSVAAGNAGSHQLTGLTVGARFNAVEPLGGDLGEILVYSRTLTTTERQQVESYLTAKWVGGAATANAESASVPVAAADAAAAVVVNADAATVGFTAADATVSTAAQTTANAESATVGVTAADAGVAVAATAGAAVVTFEAAEGVERAVAVDAGPASVPLTAADATVSVSGTTTANAESATISFAAADATVQVTGPEGAPDAIVSATNLTGTVGELWDDPEAPDAAFLDATDPAAATDLRVSFPTPSVAPGSGGPRTFRVYVRRTGGAGADPTIIIDLWEAGSFKAQLASTTVTSTTGQLVTGTLDPADLTDPSGAGVELRVRGVPV